MKIAETGDLVIARIMTGSMSDKLGKVNSLIHVREQKYFSSIMVRYEQE